MLVAIKVSIAKEQLRGVVRRHLTICRIDRVQIPEFGIQPPKLIPIQLTILVRVAAVEERT